MKGIYVFLAMIFCHIVDDYYLQGWLASAKQKEWWEKNAPQKLYKYDYIWALIMHSFSWTFVMMLPTAVFVNFNIDVQWIVVFVTNVICHACVDNTKANDKIINLWIDQLTHIGQIALTAIILL